VAADKSGDHATEGRKDDAGGGGGAGEADNRRAFAERLDEKRRTEMTAAGGRDGGRGEVG
jgi:hypothetical protein